MVRELGRVLFGRQTMPHVELGRWMHDDVGGLKTNDPVLLSQGVPGSTLQEVLVRDAAGRDAVLNNLDPRSVSEAIILAMLTMPEDGKPDNYICEHLGDGTYGIVCIDNDHAFAPPFCTGKAKGAAKLVVKCVLFCMDQMQHTIHPDVRDALCNTSFSPLDVVQQWLGKLQAINAQNRALYEESGASAKTLWSHSKAPCVIGVPVPPGAVAKLCDKLRRLKLFLGQAGACSHMQILSEVEPQLAARYLRASSEDDVWARFKEIDGSGFEVVKGVFNTTLGTHVMMTSLLQVFKNQVSLVEMVQAGTKCSPVQARDELDKLRLEWQAAAESTLKLVKGLISDESVNTLTSLGVIPSDVIEAFLGRVDFRLVSPQLQQRVLTMLASASTRLNRVVLNGFSALDQRSVVSLAPPGCCLKVLKLINCGDFAVSSSTTVTLAKCPTLRSLTIDGCPRLERFAARDGVVFHSKMPAPVRFAGLEVLRLVNCPTLKTVVASFSGPKPCRVITDNCPALVDLLLSGNVDWGKCPPAARYYMPDVRVDFRRALAVGAYSTVVHVLRPTYLRCDSGVGESDALPVFSAVGNGGLVVTNANFAQTKAILLAAIAVGGATSITASQDNWLVQPDLVDALLKWRAEAPGERKLVLTKGNLPLRYFVWRILTHTDGNKDVAMVLQEMTNTDTDFDFNLPLASIGGFSSAIPLFIAAENCHVGVVRVLIDAQADVNEAMADGKTPLWIAAERGHVDVVRALIDGQADVDQAAYGMTALWIAASKGDINVVATLIDGHADVHRARPSDGTTPLHCAAVGGHIDVIKALTSAGADVHATDNNGCTPLGVSQSWGTPQTVNALRMAGATR